MRLLGTAAGDRPGITHGCPAAVVTAVSLGVSGQPGCPPAVLCHGQPCPMTPVLAPGLHGDPHTEMNGVPVPSAAAALCLQEQNNTAELFFGEWIPPTPEFLCRSFLKARSDFFWI